MALDTTLSPLSRHLRAEHTTLEAHLDALLTTAHAVGVVPVDILREMTGSILVFLQRELLPHAEAEDRILYPAVERALGSPRAADTMRRDHAQVDVYSRELSDLLGSLAAGHDVTDWIVHEMRRVLYGLHAVVRLHFLKEQDVYAPILETDLPPQEQEALLSDLTAHPKD